MATSSAADVRAQQKRDLREADTAEKTLEVLQNALHPKLTEDQQKSFIRNSICGPDLLDGVVGSDELARGATLGVGPAGRIIKFVHSINGVGGAPGAGDAWAGLMQVMREESQKLRDEQAERDEKLREEQRAEQAERDKRQAERDEKLLRALTPAKQSKPASNANTMDWQDFGFAEGRLRIPPLQATLKLRYNSILGDSLVRNKFRNATEEKPDMHNATALFLERCIAQRAESRTLGLKIAREVGFHSAEYKLHGFMDKVAYDAALSISPEEERPSPEAVATYRCSGLIFMSCEEEFVKSSERPIAWKQSTAQLGASMSAHVEAAVQVHSVELPYVPGILLVQEQEDGNGDGNQSVLETRADQRTSSRSGKRKRQQAPPHECAKKERHGAAHQLVGAEGDGDKPLQLRAKCLLFTPNPKPKQARWAASDWLQSEEDVCAGFEWCFSKAEQLLRDFGQLPESEAEPQEPEAGMNSDAVQDDDTKGSKSDDGQGGDASTAQRREARGGVQTRSKSLSGQRQWWSASKAKRLGPVQLKVKEVLSGARSSEQSVLDWIRTGFYAS